MAELEGRRLAQLRFSMNTLFEERKQVLLNRLIADYRSNSLEHDKMVGAIAEISSMKETLDRLNRQIGETDG